MSYKSRLDHAFSNAPELPLDRCSKYVLFSDCHRGTGASNDNFLKNQHLYFAAMQHYYDEGFTYIELGDGDELWENRKLKSIIDIHSNVFWLFSLFRRQNRLYLLYGNHDIVKRNKRYCKKYFDSYVSGESRCEQPLLPGVCFHEGLILRNYENPDHDIYLTHGHQASLLNSTFWRLARFLVRYVWSPVEKLGFNDPTSAAKNYSAKESVELRLNKWAADNHHILITGHTHRPELRPDEEQYFNSGSCVHPRCITCIEIQRKTITLVKWYMSTHANQLVYVAREVLAGPFYI